MLKIARLWEELKEIEKKDNERNKAGFGSSDSYIWKLGEIKNYVEELLVTIQTSPDPTYLPYCIAMTELTYYNSKMSVSMMKLLS